MSHKLNFTTFLAKHEKVVDPFEPDALLYLESLHNKTHLEPEKRLMLAVLENGLDCFHKCLFAREGRGRRLFCEAEEWILEEDNDELFSFGSICEALGFNPQCVRGRVLWWRDIKLAQISKWPFSGTKRGERKRRLRGTCVLPTRRSSNASPRLRSVHRKRGGKFDYDNGIEMVQTTSGGVA